MGFVPLISEVNESGVPPLPLSSLFDTPSVRTSFDVSSEMSVFKTATSGSGTSMSSDMNKKVKNRSRVTSGTSMSSGMYKRAKKRSSEPVITVAVYPQISAKKPREDPVVKSAMLAKIHHMPLMITAAVVTAPNLATIHHMPLMITAAVVTALKLAVCP